MCVTKSTFLKIFTDLSSKQAGAIAPFRERLGSGMDTEALSRIAIALGVKRPICKIIIN